VALKNEFDKTSYWIVLVRCLTGALLGAIPGVIYLSYTDYHLSNNSFGAAIIQTGVLVGALSFGLAALAATIVAALKSRGTGHVKASRLKEYLNPDTLPAIPPASKPASKGPEQTEEKQVPLTLPPTIEKMQEVVKPVAVQPEQPVFEDFDR
jgi:hypothetical protein